VIYLGRVPLEYRERMNTPALTVPDRRRRSLSVVIPAFNEELRIPPTLTRVHDFLTKRGYDAEMIVVDDGSGDGTSAVVRRLCAELPLLQIITLPRNQGPGQAVRAGVLAATKEAILYTDADLSTPIEDVDRLWPSYDEGHDVVMASRHLQQSRMETLQPLHRRIMGRVFRLVVGLLCVRGFRDTQCGFKLYRADTAKTIFARIKSRRFTFNIEFLLHARKRGLRIAEVPVRWNDVAGTKISVLKESFRTITEILKIRGILPSRQLFSLNIYTNQV
jgi:dolichyl-phosphate beta-glucosyltransferase